MPHPHGSPADNPPPPAGRHGSTRRGFLLGAATGLAAGAAGAAAAWWGARKLPPGLLDLAVGPYTARPAEVARPEFGMPGPYPGRVVEVRHPESVSRAYKINQRAVDAM